MKTSFKEKCAKFKNHFLNMLFPKHIKCIFCRHELDNLSNNDTCSSCLKTLPFITNCCDRCGLPVPDDFLGVCQQCKNQNYNFVKARGVLSYTGSTRSLVRRVKFRSKKVLIPQMANYMVELFKTWNIKVDFVTFVPMFPTKEKSRGFNQAKLLAEEFSNKTQIPITYCCEKVLNTQNQTDLSFQKRKENILDAFKVKADKRLEIKNKTILVIDDVFTTGATTSELSKTLKRAGAKDCYVLTFAHTLLKH